MCIFCEIIKGNIPCYKVYEDNDCIVFLDISQATIGHTLVVPKNHYKNILDIDDELSSKLFKVVSELSKKVCKALNVENVNIVNNNGALAGQSVEHFHIHIIPRYENDGFNINYPSNKLTTEQFIELLNKLK